MGYSPPRWPRQPELPPIHQTPPSISTLLTAYMSQHSGTRGNNAPSPISEAGNSHLLGDVATGWDLCPRGNKKARGEL
ncbi:hypothetical protein Tter_2288 [Thermobaculum terrenum ATCC BAA-798]|uniref:Uncharacterized protein n=1 Tax=Thermobaculum terrenum (strain ATCC BAA-798 / CCMEE 7001 / YNP1) TaxID=525904 RepID=D1CHG6_THET1|nr:hypothetical protein Tter_2288 [Thermobaculum terrenum ATCC BAA-798]